MLDDLTFKYRAQSVSFCVSYHKLLNKLECYTLNRMQVRVTLSLSGTVFYDDFRLVLVLAVVRTYLLVDVIALPNVAYFMCNNITYRIVESKNPGFKEGDYVVANFGWRTHTISNGENVYKLDQNMYTDQKLSTALGVLGMPG